MATIKGDRMMTARLFDLSGRKAFITGATKGIGRAVADAFADHGATFVLTSRSQAEAEEVALTIDQRVGRGAAFGMAADLADLARTIEAYDEAVKLLGQIDILVCNAAALPNAFAAADKIDLREYERMVSVNIVNNAGLINHAAAAMKERRDGDLLVTTSSTGVWPAFGVMPYGVSKAGLNFLVEALGAELAPYNVRVNAVAPGLTRTAAMEERSRLDPEFMQTLTKSIPLRRVVEPEAIAAGMVFLASSGGRSMTGQILSIDGGRPGLGAADDL